MSDIAIYRRRDIDDADDIVTDFPVEGIIEMDNNTDGTVSITADDGKRIWKYPKVTIDRLGKTIIHADENKQYAYITLKAEKLN